MSTNEVAALRTYSSDNAAGTSPEILAAVVAVAEGVSPPYGADQTTARMNKLLSSTFECPLDAFIVNTGTAANGLALAVLAAPWQGVLTHVGAHINDNEAGGPEFFTGGAKLLPVQGPDSKIAPASLLEAIESRRGDVQGVPPAVLSLTQSTESGSAYSIFELTELCTIAHQAGLRVHMDGARFANAMVALGVGPAEMSWQCGVDVLSFGATKNGSMSADLVISFDKALGFELTQRHKRAGQLGSKMRFQSAQINAYLTDDLWLRNALQANAMCARLCEELTPMVGVEVLGSPQTNIIFAKFPQVVIDGLRQAGFSFYGDRWGPGIIRLVTSFAHKDSDIDLFVRCCHNLVGR